MDRIKRLSYEVLDTHKSKFGEDFADNKKILDQISIIRSKGLKNEVAGYITKFIKKEIREEKTKQTQAQSTIVSEQPMIEIEQSDTTISNEEILGETTAEPTAETTAEPTAETTAEPTAETTAEPTAETTAEPTAETTAEPTAETTAEPTAETTKEQ